ncbi:MAG: Trm112 family protein [Actinomycetota bacterium]
MPLPVELMAILQCPACRGKVVDAGEAVVCTACGLHYPIRDGIPFMLAEEAYRPPEGPT